jgi:hypothetical protein
MLFRFAATAATLSLLAIAPAHAAIELEPGLWQDTETGTKNGEPIKPEVSTDCMTPEEAKDPLRGLSAKDSGGECKTREVKREGNAVTLVTQCVLPNQISLDMTTVYTFGDRKHYTGTIKSTVRAPGRQMIFEKQVDSKWLGVCKK